MASSIKGARLYIKASVTTELLKNSEDSQETQASKMATTVIQLVILALTGTMITAAAVGRYTQADEHLIVNCCELVKPSSTSGDYYEPINVEVAAYCSEGGWLVIQKRQDGSVDFNRTWVEYENGFGSLTSEFWYGLKSLNYLTSKGTWEMMIDVELTDGTVISLHYRTFKVGPAKDMYRLTIGEFQGTIDDPMAYHNRMRFTTKDVDNDRMMFRNCALYRGPEEPTGGWWYNRCWHINPNMILQDNASGLTLNNNWHGFKSVQMKIRSLDCAL